MDVSGVNMFNGVIDGKEIDSATMFILEELDAKSGNSKGSRTTENRCVGSDLVKRLLREEFPLKCKLVYERQVSKNGEKLIIIDAKPFDQTIRKAA
jgi:hypothetical protein